jgi:AraC-like DNA-binding protein
MNTQSFDAIVALPLLSDLASAFPKVTGLNLNVVSTAARMDAAPMESLRNQFCRIIVSTPQGCARCRRVHLKLQQCAGLTPRRCEIHCLAGLRELAVPVLADGRHVATLVAGPMVARRPTRRALRQLASELQPRISDAEWTQAEKAYSQIPVFSHDQREATQRLLSLFAKQIGTALEDSAVPSSGANEPACVAEAKKYVAEHLLDNVRSRHAARAVHLSLQHFCRVFHRATGETFTEYLLGQRVKKAKQLLAKPQLTISEAAFGCGFRSFPWFDRVFKRHTGRSPRQFRAALKSSDS